MKREAFVAFAILLFAALVLSTTLTTFSEGSSSEAVVFVENISSFSYITLPKLAVVAGNNSAGKVSIGNWNASQAGGASLLASVQVGDYFYYAYENGHVQKVSIADGSILWTVRNATNHTNAIANDSEFVYTGHDAGYIQKINLTTGELVWTVQRQTNDTKAIAADGTYVFAGYRNGHLHRLFALNGSFTNVWSAETPSASDFVSLDQDADYLYTGHTNGHLRRVSKTDGTNDWEKSYTSLNTLLEDGNYVFLGRTDGTFDRINKGDGTSSWTSQNSTEGIYSLAADTDFLYTGHDNGYWQRINKSDGRDLSIFQNDTNRVNSMIHNGTSLYLGQAYGHAQKFNASNALRFVWADATSDINTINAMVDDADYLYTGHDLGRIQKVRKADGYRMWTVYNTTNKTHSILTDQDFIYAGQDSGYLVKVNKTSGLAVWFSRNNTGTIYALANDSDTIYTGGAGGYYQKINKSNAVPLWGEVNGTTDIKAIFSDGSNVYTGHTGGWVQQVNMSNGVALWETRNSTQDLNALSGFGEFLYTGHANGVIQKINKSSGATVLTLVNNTADIKSLVVDSQAIYTGHANGYYQKYNISSGVRMWLKRDNPQDINALSVDVSYIYSAHPGGHIQKIRKEQFGAFFDIVPSGQDLESYCLDNWADWCPDSHGNPINFMAYDGQYLYQVLEKGYALQLSLAGETQLNIRESKEDANALVVDGDFIFTGHDSGYYQRINKSSSVVDYSQRDDQNAINAMANVSEFFFTGHDSGYVQKINKSSGAANWTVRNETRNIYAMIGDPDFVYTGHADGYIQKVNTSDGTFVWTIVNNTNDIKAMVLDTGSFYTAGVNGYVQKINISNGVPLWGNVNRTNDINALVADSNAVYAAGINGYVQKFNKSNGVPLWEAVNITHDVQSLALAGEFIYLGHSSGLMQQVNKTSGAFQNWQRPSQYTYTVRAVAKGGDYIFTGHSDGYYQLLATSGTVGWQARNLTANILSLVADENYLYLGHSNGTVLKVNNTNGEVLWAAQNSTQAANALALRDFVYSGHSGGFIQKINITNGAVVQTVSNITENISSLEVGSIFVYSGHIDGYIQYINTSFIANSSLTNVTQMNLQVNRTRRNNTNDVVSMTSDSTNLYVSYDNGYIQKFDLFSSEVLLSWLSTQPTTATAFGLVVDGSDLYTGTANGIYHLSASSGSISDRLNTTESYNAIHSAIAGMVSDSNFVYPVYSDGWVQKVAKQMKPVNPWIDVGNNSVRDWQFTGYFDIAQQTADVSEAINTYLATCKPVQGNCDIPIVVHSTSAGTITLQDLNITYLVNKTDPIFDSMFASNPARNATQQNISAVILDDGSLDSCLIDFGSGNISMSRDGTDCQYNWTLVDTDIVRYTIHVNDSEGNWVSNTSTFNVRITLNRFNNSQITTNVSLSAEGSGQVGISIDRYLTIVNASLNVTAFPDEVAGQDLFCQNEWDTCMRYQDKTVYASVADEQFIYYGSEDGYVRKVNKSSGIVSWTLLNVTTDVRALANDSSFVYSAHLNGYVQKIAKSDGAVQWIVQNNTNDTYGIAVDGSNVFTGHADGYIQKMSLAGVIDATFANLQYNGNDTTSMVLDSTYLYTGHKDGGVQSVLKSIGSFTWSLVNNAQDVNALGADDEFVYAGKTNGHLEKINKSTGALNWTVQTTATLYTYSVVAEEDYVYTGHLNGYIQKRDKDGNLETGWDDVRNSSATVNTLSMDSEFVYTGQNSGLTQKYNRSSTKHHTDWSNRPRLSSRVLDSALDQDYLFTIELLSSNYYLQKYKLSNGYLDPYYSVSSNILTSRNPTHIAVGPTHYFTCSASTTQDHNKTNASEVWSRAIGCTDIATDTTHVYVGKDNKVYKLHKGTGATIWSRDTNGSISHTIALSAITLDVNHTYVGMENGYLEQINKSNGEQEWVARNSTKYVNALVVDESFLYSGHAGGQVQKVNKNTGAVVWTINNQSNDILSLANDSSFVYAGDTSGYIYKIEKSSGTVVDGWDDFRNSTLPVTSLQLMGNSVYTTHNNTGTNLQKLWKAKYPRNPTFDFLGNGTDWSYTGIFTMTASQNIKTDIESYRSTCNKTCNVPANLTFASRGILQLDNLNITYVLDTTAPKLDVVNKTDPIANLTQQNISIGFSDNVGVSLCYMNYQFGNTSSGNLTMSLGSTQCWYNWTATQMGLVNYTVFVADNSYNWANLSGTFSVQDIIMPYHVNQSHTYSILNESQSNQLRSYWFDNGPLDTAVLETNKTGVWLNESYMNMTSNETWGNFSFSTTGYGNSFIGWRIHVNDTYNNFNATPVMGFFITDVLPPTISSFTLLPTIVGVNSTLTLSATVTDSDTVSSVFANITKGARLDNVTLTASGSSYSATSTINETGVYNITLYAVDDSGNMANSTTSFTAKVPIIVNFTAVNASGTNEGLVLAITHSSGTIYEGNTTDDINTTVAKEETYTIALTSPDGFKATMTTLLNDSQVLSFKYEHRNSSSFTNVSGGGIHKDRAFAFEPQFSINSTVCANYSGLSYVASTNIKIYRRAWSFSSRSFSGSWEDVTNSRIAASKLVCARVSNYSMFSIVEKPYWDDGICESRESCISGDCNVSTVSRCWQNDTDDDSGGGGGGSTIFFPTAVSSFNLSAPGTLETTLGTPLDFTLRVGNDGNMDLANLTLTLYGMDSEWYAVAPTKLSLAYSETKDFKVNVTPLSEGKFNLTLIVASEDVSGNITTALTVFGIVEEQEPDEAVNESEVGPDDEVYDEADVAGEADFIAQRIDGLKTQDIDTLEYEQKLAEARALIAEGKYAQAQEVLDELDTLIRSLGPEPVQAAGPSPLPLIAIILIMPLLILTILIKTDHVPSQIKPYTEPLARTIKKAESAVKFDELGAKLSPYQIKLNFTLHMVKLKFGLAAHGAEVKTPKELSRVELKLFNTLRAAEAALHALHAPKAEALYERALKLYNRLEVHELPSRKKKMNAELVRVYYQVSILFQVHYARESLETGNLEDAAVRYTKAMDLYNKLMKKPRGDEGLIIDKLNKLYADIEMARNQ